MGALTKGQILKAKVEFQNVPTPELSEDDNEAYIRIKSFSSAVRDKWDMQTMKQDPSNPKKMVPDFENYRSKLLALCICDDDGNLLFSTEEVVLLAEQNAAVMDRVYQACLKINGLGSQAVEEDEGN